MIPLRDENPTGRLPIFTVLIIIANSWLFFYQLGLGIHLQDFIMQMGAIPFEITGHGNLPSSTLLPPFASVFTSMFLHGGVLHLLGNMWFLWIFGDNIEDFLGHFNFLLFYMISGIVATLTHVYFNPSSKIPLVGASGAISGILGAYFILHPRIRILTLVPIFIFITFLRVPAYFFLGVWVIINYFGFMNPTGQVAYGAHIGGFVAGVLLIFLMSRGSMIQPASRHQPRRSPRRRW